MPHYPRQKRNNNHDNHRQNHYGTNHRADNHPPWLRCRIMGLIIVVVVILSVEPMFTHFHRLLRDRLESIDASSNTLKVVPLSVSPSGVKLNQSNESFAPIIIGAGQGTTGTHLFLEATCELGFVSLHYLIGCLPKSAFSVDRPAQQFSTSNVSDANNDTAHRYQTKQERSCPVSIDHFRDPYPTMIVMEW